MRQTLDSGIPVGVTADRLPSRQKLHNKGETTMPYKIIIIEKSFNSGLVTGQMRSHLLSNASGRIDVIGETEDTIELEVVTRSHEIMSWVEDKLAAFV